MLRTGVLSAGKQEASRFLGRPGLDGLTLGLRQFDHADDVADDQLLAHSTMKGGAEHFRFRGQSDQAEVATPPAVTLIELCDLANRVLTNGSGNTATILDSLTERSGILAAQAAEADLPGPAQPPEKRKAESRMDAPTAC